MVLNLIGLDIGGALAFVLGYLILGREVLTAAWKNLSRGHVLDENFLMSVATIGAFCIGEFPEAVGVMLFYRVGEFFEHKAVERSRSQIMEAIDLRPEVVQLASGETIPAEEAQVGDILIVRPGDRIPLDGVVVKGDSRSANIAAASVLAKVTRDIYMEELAEKYPQYGFEIHKGYGTKAHYAALTEHGMCDAHRRTFLRKFYGEK